MKHDPRETKLRERMAPGALSRDGFLGTDDRNIGDIVAQDCDAVDAAGLTLEQLAGLLDELHKAADNAFGTTVRLYDGRARVLLEAEVKGLIPCPFPCGVRSHKAVIDVTWEGGSFSFTPLNAHMIRDHGFFQGRDASFRIEPADLIALYRACHESGDESHE